MPDAAGKIHTPVQHAGDINPLAGDRIDHDMLLDIESKVPVGEVGTSVPKAGIAGDGHKCLIDGGGVAVPLRVPVGLIRVLQDTLNVPLGLTGRGAGYSPQGRTSGLSTFLPCLARCTARWLICAMSSWL